MRNTVAKRLRKKAFNAIADKRKVFEKTNTIGITTSGTQYTPIDATEANFIFWQYNRGTYRRFKGLYKNGIKDLDSEKIFAKAVITHVIHDKKDENKDKTEVIELWLKTN